MSEVEHVNAVEELELLEKKNLKKDGIPRADALKDDLERIAFLKAQLAQVKPDDLSEGGENTDQAGPQEAPPQENIADVLCRLELKIDRISDGLSKQGLVKGSRYLRNLGMQK